MIRYFLNIKKNCLRIFLLFILLFAVKIGCSQAFKWLDGYKMSYNIGGRIIVYNSYPILGLMGGLKFQHAQKRLGLNIRLNYIIPKLYKVDLQNFDNSSYLIYYSELTYKPYF